MLLYVALSLIGIAVFLVTNLMFQEEDEYKAKEKLEDGAASNRDLTSQQGFILKYSRPFFRRYVTPIVSSFKNKKKIKERYRQKLASAGLTEILSPEDFFSFKLFLIIGFPITFLVLRAFLEETWALELVFVLGPFGFIYPDLWIKGRIEARQKEIIRSMPFSVDMLALSVEAGLDFIAAMKKVIEKAKPSALTYEFNVLLKEIQIGSSRAEALRNMAWRVNLIQVSSFCATLIAADSVGASIGPILKSLSQEIRQKKSAEVEKAGATAATKILFPMLFLIVPAVFIIVAAPIALEAVAK
jgi:tight adherence protein C